MAKTAILFVLLVAILGNFLDKNVEACYLDAIGGGCPDQRACLETCRPCYRGIGGVLAYCVAPGGGINIWRCRCEFKNSAPCPPRGPPTCPAPPSRLSKISGQVEKEQNVTENVISPILRYP